MHFDTAYINSTISADLRIKSNLNRILYLIIYYVKQNKKFLMGTKSMANTLHLHPQTIKNNLKKLEHWGYIIRTRIHSCTGHVRLRIINLGKALLKSLNYTVFSAVLNAIATGAKSTRKEEGKYKNNNHLFDTQDRLFSEQHANADFQQIINAAPRRTAGHDLSSAYSQYKLTIFKYMHSDILRAIKRWKLYITKNNYNKYYIWELSEILKPAKLINWLPRKYKQQNIAPQLPCYRHNNKNSSTVQDAEANNSHYKQQLQQALQKAKEKHFIYLQKAEKKGDEGRKALMEVQKHRCKISNLEVQISRTE